MVRVMPRLPLSSGSAKPACSTSASALPPRARTAWSATHGRKPDEQRLLTTAQEQAIKRLIGRHMPDELGLDFARWSRAAVQALIRRQYGVRLAVRTTGTYLARRGFTAQKPLRRAYEQNPAEVRHWLRHEYPAIVARARRARGVIFWGDETGLSR